MITLHEDKTLKEKGQGPGVLSWQLMWFLLWDCVAGEKVYELSKGGSSVCVLQLDDGSCS